MTDAVRGALWRSTRWLRANPLLATIVVVSFSLGIGVNGATFAFLDILMSEKPPQVLRPEQIVEVPSVVNYVQFLRIRQQTRTLDIASYTYNDVSFGVGAEAFTVRAACVTPEYFTLLGTPAHLGRMFTSAADPFTAVLGDGFWRKHFGGDGAVIGRALILSGRQFTVSGVTPPGFRGVGLEPVDVWIQMTAVPEACSFTGDNLLLSAGGAWLRTIGRIRDSNTLLQAQAEVASLGGAEYDGKPGAQDVPGQVRLEPIAKTRRSGLSRESRTAIWLLAGAFLVFLLACSNVAGLLSVRTVERGREFAVRIQLGASRSRVFAQLLGENCLLAAISCGPAILVTRWTGLLLDKFYPFGITEHLMSGKASIVIGAFAALAALLSGLAPAIQGARVGVIGLVTDAQAAVPRRSRLRRCLLVIQVALGFALVMGASLFVRSVQNLRADPGYDLDDVIVASADFRRTQYGTDEDIRLLWQRMLNQVLKVPAVSRAALSTGPVLNSGGAIFAVPLRSVPGRQPSLSAVSPEYFASVGTRILRGRAFSADDNGQGEVVIVLNSALASALWPDRDPIGQCLTLAKIPCARVVGVCESRRSDSLSTTGDEIFMPLAGAEARYSRMLPTVLVMRPRVSSHDAIRAVAQAIRGSASALPAIKIVPLGDLADAQTRAWRLGATLFGMFGGLSMLLASIGTYGLVALAVRHRTREIGLRLALGANRRHIAFLVCSEVLVLVAIGILLGVALATASARVVSSLLFGVTPMDLASFGVASLAMCASGVAGVCIPAIRAVCLAPADALRFR